MRKPLRTQTKLRLTKPCGLCGRPMPVGCYEIPGFENVCDPCLFDKQGFVMLLVNPVIAEAANGRL